MGTHALLDQLVKIMHGRRFTYFHTISQSDVGVISSWT